MESRGAQVSQAVEGGKAGTCRAWIALGRSDLYPERNGVPLKVFKCWADRPDLHFQKEPLYLIDRGSGEVNTCRFLFQSFHGLLISTFT